MITHAEFSMQVSFMASNCSSWAGDCLTLPEEHAEPMRDEPVERFISNMRERLTRLEEWHKRPKTQAQSTASTKKPNQETSGK